MTDNNESKIELVSIEQQNKSDEKRTLLITKQKAPTYNFVSRIKGFRDVHQLTETQFIQKAQDSKKNKDWTLQEYYNGSTVVKPYLDADWKEMTVPDTEKGLKELIEARYASLQEVVKKLFPGNQNIEYAERHRPLPPGDKGVYKVSFRVYVTDKKCTVNFLGAYVRAVLGLDLKAVHPFIDLGVYKEKEQLLCVVYAYKDIEPVEYRKALTPMDVRTKISKFLVQNVEGIEDDLLMPARKIPEDFFSTTEAKGKGKGKGKKAATAVVEAAITETTEDSKRTVSQSHETDGTLTKQVVQFICTTFPGKKYRAGDFKSVRPSPDGKFLYIEMKTKTCESTTHKSNHSFILLYPKKAVFKCFDEACKAANPKGFERSLRGKVPPYEFQGVTTESKSIWDAPECWALHEEEKLNKLSFEAFRDVSHVALAEYLFAFYGDQFYFDSSAIAKRNGKCWWYYANHRWNVDGGDRIRHLFATTFRDRVKAMLKDPQAVAPSFEFSEESLAQFTQHIAKIHSSVSGLSMIGALETACQIFFGHERTEEFLNMLDRNLSLFGFKNGVYDLGALSFREGRPSDRISIQVEYDYVPYDPASQSTQQLEKILQQILPIAKVRHFILKLYASALGAHSTDKIWLQCGGGSNGKSFVTLLMEMALGPYATAWSTSLLRVEFDPTKPNVELTNAKNKRFINVQEGKQDTVLNMENVKKFTGDDTLQSRMLHENGGAMSIIALILFSTNNPPTITGADLATWRRFRAIFWPSKFVENVDEVDEKNHVYLKDAALSRRVRFEKQYVTEFMSILIHYYALYKAEGLNSLPQDIQQATEKFKASQSMYTKFFKDSCNLNPAGKVHRQSVVAACQAWAKTNVLIVNPTALTVFLDGMGDKGVRSFRNIKIKGLNQSGYRGFTLNGQEDVAEKDDDGEDVEQGPRSAMETFFDK